MIRRSWLAMMIGAAACSSSSQTRSGVTETKKLYELSSGETDQLCEFRIDVERGPRTAECPDMSSVILPGKTSCVSELDSITVQCTATVSDAENCFEAEARDACAADAACMAYRFCRAAH
jgi:hypothetical protein